MQRSIAGKPVPVRAVFFDLSETLIHYEPTQEALLAQACRDFGFDITERQARKGFLAAGAYWRRAVAQLPLARRTPGQQQALFAEYDRRALAAAGLAVSPGLALQIFEGLLDRSRTQGNALVLYADVLPTLAVLKERGLLLGVISNLGTELQDVCRTLGLAEWLDVIVGPSAAGVEKPDPGIFLEAVALVGVPPDACIYVGDQPEIDVRGAQAAGLRPVLLDRWEVLTEFRACPRLTSLARTVDYLC